MIALSLFWEKCFKFQFCFRTLYSQLNHCVTAFGKRLLKTWLARPLYHVESIKARQGAVASLRVGLIITAINEAFLLQFLYFYFSEAV